MPPTSRHATPSTAILRTCHRSTSTTAWASAASWMQVATSTRRGAWLITSSARTPASILEPSRNRCITSVTWPKALATTMISKQAAAALGELNSLLKVTAALGHHSLVVQRGPSQTWDISIRIQESSIFGRWKGRRVQLMSPLPVPEPEEVFTNRGYQFINRLS